MYKKFGQVLQIRAIIANWGITVAILTALWCIKIF